MVVFGYLTIDGDDKEFERRFDAEIHAMEFTAYSDEVYAVWKKLGGEILSIVYQGIIYCPAGGRKKTTPPSGSASRNSA